MRPTENEKLQFMLKDAVEEVNIAVLLVSAKSKRPLQRLKWMALVIAGWIKKTRSLWYPFRREKNKSDAKVLSLCF